MPPLVGRRILIVEDDPWVAKLLEFVVSDAGHVPIVARDGHEAFERFVDGMPDMAFIDVVLPRSDGLKLCRRIKDTALGTMIPVVCVSGIYKDKREATRVFGADAFLTKPFTPEQIGAQIKALLAPYAVAAAGSVPAGAPIRLVEGESSLRQEPIARVVSRLYLDGKTGLLSVRSGTANKFFFFEDGELVYARGSASVAGVGGLLLAMGRLSLQQLEPLERAARAKGPAGDKRHITQLVTEAGLVAPEELRRLAVGQQLAEVFAAFTWREGAFSFVEGPNDLKDAVLMGVDTASILQWGVRKMEPQPTDLDAIAPRDALLQRSADADRRLRNLLLSAGDKQILGLIDGKKTVREILGVAAMAGLDATCALYTFLCTGAAVPGLAAEAPAPVPAPGEAVQGPLAGPFPMALMQVWRRGASGVLTCEGPNSTFRVYVREGNPVFARTDREEDRLEAMLIRAGKLAPEVAWQALEEQRQRPSLRVGRILVEMGAITLEELHWAVKYQVQNILLAGFTWREGRFRFEPGALPTAEAITLDWDAPNAVLEGIRGLPLQSVSPLLPPPATVLERVQDSAAVEQRVKLNSYESKILSLVYGRQPLEQLLAMSFVTPREAHRAVLVFLALGLLKPVGGAPAAAAPGEPASAAPPAPALPEIHVGGHEEGEEVVFAASTRTAEEEERIAAEAHSDEPGFTLFAPASPPPPGPPAPVQAAQPNAFAASPAPSLEQFAAQFGAPAAQAPVAAPPPPPAAAAPPEPAAAPAAPPAEAARAHAPEGAGAPAGWSAPTADLVPRWLYEELMQEKRDMEKRLWVLLDERRGGEEREVVPRADYEMLLEEKRKLQEKLLQVLDELLDLRSRARESRDTVREPIPFPRGGRKPGESA